MRELVGGRYCGIRISDLAMVLRPLIVCFSDIVRCYALLVEQRGEVLLLKQVSEVMIRRCGFRSVSCCAANNA